MNKIIFMVNIDQRLKPNRTDPYQFSIASWSKYAKKIGARLYILDKWIVEESKMNANWHKLFVFQLLDSNHMKYDRILIVDADTIIHPDAPDIFEEYTSDKFKAVHNSGSYDWLLRSMEIYKKYVFNSNSIEVDFPFTEYFNSGVMIVSPKHKEFFKEVLDLYMSNNELFKNVQNTFHVGTDQPVLNFMLHHNNIEYELMDYAWNMQDMVCREILNVDLLFTEYGWIYHFNAIPEQFKLRNENTSPVYQWMEYTYNKLYA